MPTSTAIASQHPLASALRPARHRVPFGVGLALALLASSGAAGQGPANGPAAVPVSSESAAVSPGSQPEATIADDRAGAAPTSPVLPREPGFGVRVTADVWIPRLEGNVTFGGPSLELGEEFDLDRSEAAFDGTGELRFGLWGLAISGFDFSVRNSAVVQQPTPAGAPTGPGIPFVPVVDWGGVVAPPGSTIDSRFAIASAAVEGSWDLWRPLSDRRWAWGESVYNDRNVAPDGGYIVDLRLGVLGGGRWTNIEQSMTVQDSGDQARYDGDWFALYGGARLALDLRIPDQVPVLRRLSVFAAAGVGGVVSGASGSYWQVRAGVEFFLLRNIALSAGYQLVEFDADDDDYTFDGGLQGLWVGGTVCF